MPRTPQYDLKKVIDSATKLFWKKGYEGVSMADIVETTGLNRGSMYSLFKDKDGLFKAILENYYKQIANKDIEILKNNRGKEGIKIFFENFVFKKNYKGCLFSSTINEKDFISKENYEIAKEFFEKLKKSLEKNLIEAYGDGEFSGDIKAMALTLITLIHGLHVHAKYNDNKTDSEAIVQNIMNIIK